MTTPEPMTSRERVLAALRGDPVDRTPVVNPTSIATVELMDLVDAPFPDANREPELMARLAATRPHRARLRLRHAGVLDHPGLLGARLQDPVGAEGQLADGQDDRADLSSRRTTSTSTPMPCSTHPDTQCVIEAIKILRRELGEDVAIIGKTMGPWSMGYHTFGVEPFLLMSLDDQDKTKLVLERLKQLTIDFGVMQIEAGADALTLPDHATGRPRLGRVLPPLPARSYTRSSPRRSRRRSSCTSAGAPSIACPTSRTPAWRPSTTTRRTIPSSRWRPLAARSGSSATSTIPRRSSRAVPTRSKAEVKANLDAGVQMVGSRVRHARSRRRSRTSGRFQRPCSSGHAGA